MDYNLNLYNIYPRLPTSVVLLILCMFGAGA